MRGSNKYLPMAVRHEIRRRYFGGDNVCDIARDMKTSPQSVYRITRAMPFPPRKMAKGRLTLQERFAIEAHLTAGCSMRDIARRLKRAPSTISREVAGRKTNQYYAVYGNDRAEVKAARPKQRKLEANEELRAAVEAGLEKKWSPKQISERLRMDYPNDPAMRVSHETIYKSLFVQTRGSLRKELTRYLRHPRTERKLQARQEKRGHLPDMLLISQRPAEARDRAVPGHWEGDLLVGANNQSCIGTLVERKTRFTMLMCLPGGGTAEHVRVALTKKMLQLPEHLRATLTWDQGREMAQHTRFTIDTKVRVYFCDPRSPWQRGSNENTNGLLRQYFPKGTDLGGYSEDELDAVAAELNGRPRQTLGWRTPFEAMSELLR